MILRKEEGETSEEWYDSAVDSILEVILLSGQLLTTKFYIPPQGSKDLPRERLFTMLDQGLLPPFRLILLCAPAGYGKTTLAGDWARRLKAAGGPAVAWLSLDEGDNDPGAFLAYLISALQRALPGIGETARMLLDSPQGAPVQAVLSSLINDAAQAGDEIVLVLDDYHSLRSPSIHEGMVYWIDHLSPNIHLLLTTRSDPPFPLHRYRGRGQVLEIRLGDLRFHPGEAAEFLEHFSGLNLRHESLDLLQERTEGWITGIQMAALSMRSQADQDAFVRSLAGSNRFILDYLAEEVLKGQPEAVQQFLLRTSILERLCSPLCDAVVGPDLSLLDGQDVLDELERSNLFLIPLDEERRWYRYHHLFADLLRVRLKQAAHVQPDFIQVLHARASRWLQAEGWISEAVQQAIDGQDYEQAANLVEQHTLKLFAQGELHKLLQWIRLLPAELSARRPWLCVYQAWAQAFAGQVVDIETILRQAEQAMDGGKLSAEELRRLKGEMIAIRAMTALMSGNVRGAQPLLDLPEDALPAESLFAGSAVQWVIGYTSRMQGELPRAIQAFEEMLRLGRQMNNIWTIVSASIDLGEVLRQSGRLYESGAVYHQALEVIAASGSRNPGYLGRLEAFLAANLFERNEVAEALRLVREAMEYNRRWENPNHTTFAALVLARIAISEKDFPTAEQALEEAGEAISHFTVMPHLAAAAEGLRARLWLAEGRLAQAVQWAAAQPESTDRLDEETVGRTILCARVKLADGKRKETLDILTRLEMDARSGGKNNALIEILLLKAMAEPDRRRAYHSFEEALTLGIPAGYRRVFLDEGKPLFNLLEDYRSWLRKEAGDELKEDRISRIEILLSGSGSSDQKGKSSRSPLTEREIEILAHMAAGLTNEEIGKRLYISTGTVKAHSAAIYRKLDVANRPEAISRAKDLGLI